MDLSKSAFPICGLCKKNIGLTEQSESIIFENEICEVPVHKICKEKYDKFLDELIEEYNLNG